MIHMFRWDKGVKRRINGGRAGVQVKCTVRIVSDHGVFYRGFRTFDIRRLIKRLKSEKLFLIQRREVGKRTCS